MSWEIVELSKVADVISGATPKRNNPKYWGGDIAWVSPKEISPLKTKYISETVECITQEGYDSCSTKLLPENSILLSSRAPIGLLAINTIPICTNQGFKSLVPHVELDSVYLYYYLMHKRQFIQGLGNGATFKEISKSIVEKIQIPLPPLKTQKQIAQVLDRADALMRLRRQSIEKLDVLIESLFIEMFGDPVVNPMGWKNRKLSECVAIDAPMVEPTGEYKNLLHIGPDRIESNTGKLLPAKTAEEDGLRSKKFLFNPDYVLYSKIRPYLNKVALVDFIGLCSADMYPVKPLDGVFTKEYLWKLLQSNYFLMYTKTLPDRANIPKINRTELLAFQSPVPDYDLQIEFSEKLNTINLQKSRYQASLTSFQTLFDSLMQRAFEGELEFNDATLQHLEENVP